MHRLAPAVGVSYNPREREVAHMGTLETARAKVRAKQEALNRKLDEIRREETEWRRARKQQKLARILRLGKQLEELVNLFGET